MLRRNEGWPPKAEEGHAGAGGGVSQGLVGAAAGCPRVGLKQARHRRDPDWRGPRVNCEMSELPFSDDDVMGLLACFSSVDPKMSNVMCAMARVAVDRSCGQLEVFTGNLFVTDELLKYIGTG